MGVVNDMLKLLKRPLEAAPAESSEGKKPKGSKATERPEEAPLTEDDLIAALLRCKDERAAAVQLIETAGDRREALLMQEGTDDAIRALGAEVDRANLTIERLERIEPDLERRLKELRDQRRIRRWEELRDAYVRDLEPLYFAMQKYLAVYHEVASKSRDLQAEFPTLFQRDDSGRMPPVPLLPLFQMTPEDFKALVLTFARTGFEPNPKPVRLATTVAQMMEEAKQAGREAVAGGFGVQPTNEPVRVKLMRHWQDEYETLHKPQTILELPREIAWPLVQKGWAVEVE